MKVKLKSGVEIDLMFGTDAEFFLVNSDNKVIPASKVIPGTKEKPHKLRNGVCHPDGLSLEVGCPPSDTPEGMVTNLFKVLREVHKKYLKDNGLTVLNKQGVSISKVEGAGHKDLEFGCGVEYQRTSSDMYKHRDMSATKNLRFSGFHIHLGYTTDQQDDYFSYLDACKLVAVLDRLTAKHDLNTGKKRELQYGGLGAFRIKPYGIEYRAMDCTVITNERKFKRLMKMLDEIPKCMEELG